MRRIPTTILLFVFGLLFIGGMREAEAAPILGSIGFGGAFLPAPGTLATTTGMNVGNGNTAFVTTVSGDFASFLSVGDVVTYNDFTFNPSTGKLGLWSGGGFNFDLAGSIVIYQSSAGLVLTDGGTVSGNGFDPTPAVWSFSGDRTGNTFAFSSTISTERTAVPEPASLLLLGIGLLTAGLGVTRRHR